jgi:TolB-like protein/tetratricopeptide (TPR) repeat protein
MADVFISYTREDRPRVEALAEALVQAGYSVWWDRNIAGGARYVEETEAELNIAKAVLVVWTKASIVSHWVADEAGAGRDTGRLVPLSLDGAIPPLGFRQFQTIDFSRWQPGEEVKLAELRAALGRLVGPGSTAPGSAETPVRPVRLRRPTLFAVCALAAVAIVIAIAVFAASQDPSPSRGQRTAFFGFDAADSDAVSSSMAVTATNESFETLAALGLETVSRAETQTVKLPDQLATARKLQATYALGGAISRTGDRIEIAMHLDDVGSSTTLWEATIPGTATDIVSLPVQAASRATSVVQCHVSHRASLRSESPQILRAIVDLCKDTGLVAGPGPRYFERSRVLLALAPDSAYAQGLEALNLMAAVQTAPESQRAFMRKAIEAAIERALKSNPAQGEALATRAELSLLDGRPLMEVEQLFKAAVDAAPESAVTNRGYARFLARVGRLHDAVPLARSAADKARLGSSVKANFGRLLALDGISQEAAEVFAEANARLPTEGGWRTWVFSAIHLHIGDVDQAIEAAPPVVSGDTRACWRDVAAAIASKNHSGGLARFKECERQDAFDASDQFWVHLEFGMTAEALQDARREYSQNLPIRSNLSLFSVDDRSLRADPGFLPLVRELGIFDYWLASKTEPDFCGAPAEMNTKVCQELRDRQRGR